MNTLGAAAVRAGNYFDRLVNLPPSRGIGYVPIGSAYAVHRCCQIQQSTADGEKFTIENLRGT